MNTNLARIALALAVALVAAPVPAESLQATPPVPARATKADAARAPRAAYEELLAADRAYAAAAKDRNYSAALGAMLAPDAFVVLPRGRHATSAADAVAQLRADPEDAGSRASWQPIGGGISADGMHGYTVGSMQVQRASGEPFAARYLAYWVRGGEGWRIAAYKRRALAIAAGEASVPAPVVPASGVAHDEALAQSTADDIAAAELAFSSRAQVVGLGPAFTEFGATHAINLGGPNDAGFAVGAATIAKLVAQGEPAGGSSVEWSSDRTIAAGSGDLGLTTGMIRLNEPPKDANAPSAFPFFTVWAKQPDGAWKYVAE